MEKSLTKYQPDPNLTCGGSSDQMSTWPAVVSYLATKCLCWGYLWPKVSLTQSLTKGQPDLKSDLKPHLGGISNQMSAWTEVVSHLATRCLCQRVCLTKGQSHHKSDQMSTWPKASSQGGTSDLRSTWPNDLTKMSTWSEASSAGRVHLTKCRKVIWKFENTLHLRSCLWNTKKLKHFPKVNWCTWLHHMFHPSRQE